MLPRTRTSLALRGFKKLRIVALDLFSDTCLSISEAHLDAENSRIPVKRTATLPPLKAGLLINLSLASDTLCKFFYREGYGKWR